MDRLQADPERAVIEIGRDGPRRAVGQGEGRLARARHAAQHRTRLEHRGVTQQVDGLPEGDRLGLSQRDFPVLPLRQILGIQRDPEARLLAQRPHDVRQRRPIEIEPDARGLREQRALDLLDQARGPVADLRIGRACAARSAGRAGRPRSSSDREAASRSAYRPAPSCDTRSPNSAGSSAHLPEQHDQQEIDTEHHRHPSPAPDPTRSSPPRRAYASQRSPPQSSHHNRSPGGFHSPLARMQPDRSTDRDIGPSGPDGPTTAIGRHAPDFADR